MEIRARAPGKAAVLGEYAVLGGAPALVLAVDRHAEARITARAGAAAARVETRFPEPYRIDVEPGADTGVGLIDVVRRALPGASAAAFDAILDSSDFFVRGRKLGLGSSAAALCAWAGAFVAWTQHAGGAVEAPSLGFLIDLHRRFQGGAGSGLDVAASFAGGAIEFRSDPQGLHQVGSVRLPNGVGFAGIFAGRSASTPDLLARYHRFRTERPEQAAEHQRVMESIAEAGCAAARNDEGQEFLRAVDLYGRQLDVLGQAIGADIVTAEHRAIGESARRFGVTYKVSGAGGGDLGLALAADSDALDAFKRAVSGQGYEVVDLGLDRQGLVVEELP